MGLLLLDPDLRDRPDPTGGDLTAISIVSIGDPTINQRHPDRWGAFDVGHSSTRDFAESAVS
jgi:hypothetical protein